MWILIVDDDPVACALLDGSIRPLPDVRIDIFHDGESLLRLLEEHTADVDLLVTDWELPGKNGVQIVEVARAMPGFAETPIIMVTGNRDHSVRHAALVAGATDFVTKPVDPIEVGVRVRNLLGLQAARRREMNRARTLAVEVESATETLREREREIVFRLSRAAEFRDGDTGEHIARVSRMVGLLARGMGLDSRYCAELELAASMHDIGKIGLPDQILLKPGPLTDLERAEMQRHTEYGYTVLEGSGCSLVQLGAEIALTHHEQWDGSGYPRGLKGENIPLSGRIVAVADVFDALTHARTYKQAWSEEAALEYIMEKSGSHFDPVVVKTLLRITARS